MQAEESKKKQSFLLIKEKDFPNLFENQIVKKQNKEKYFVEQDYGSDQETVEINKATLLKDLEASINRKIKRDQIMMPATFSMTLKS